MSGRLRRRRVCLFRWLCLSALALAVVWPSTAIAAPPVVSVRFTPLSPRARVAAPIPGIWEIIYNGGEVLEGELRLTIQASYAKQQIVIPDVVVSPGPPTRFRGMLPAIDVAAAGMQELVQADMTVEFITKEGEGFPPEFQPLMFRNPIYQSFSLCVADPHMAGGTAVDRLYAEALSFDRFNPLRGDNSLVTAPAHVAPQDLPNDALGYCAFDIVLLVDEGFMEADADQLLAMTKWVRAGGSLCILPGTSLDAPHLSFLNEMAKSAKSELIFITDAEGRLSASGADEHATFARWRVGLGRVAVGLSVEQTERDVESPAWRETSAFLWKINAAHQSAIAQSGTLDATKLQQRFRRAAPPQTFDGDFGMELSLGEMLATSRSSDWSENLIGQLMPKDFRFVPLWLMGGLLLVFLLVIGPGDYFLLGALKMRKLTWILFPLTSFAFAFATVWIANVYMGVTNETHAYEILDIGQDNSVLRANRLELHYNGAAQHSETEFTNALFTPLDTTASQFRHRSAMVDEALPQVDGRFPQKFTVVQDIPQWTPRLSRQFWISPSKTVAPSPEFDFASIRVADFDVPESRGQLVARLKQAFGNECAIYLMNRQNYQILARNAEMMQSVPSRTVVNYRRGVPAGAYPPGTIVNFGHTSGDDFIRMVSAPTAVSAFGIVSQVSPAGGWSFDDLAVLDTSDPDEWLLVVAVSQGDDIVFYRRLYRNSGAEPPTS